MPTWTGRCDALGPCPCVTRAGFQRGNSATEHVCRPAASDPTWVQAFRFGRACRCTRKVLPRERAAAALAGGRAARTACAAGSIQFSSANLDFNSVPRCFSFLFVHLASPSARSIVAGRPLGPDDSAWCPFRLLLRSPGPPGDRHGRSSGRPHALAPLGACRALRPRRASTRHTQQHAAGRPPSAGGRHPALPGLQVLGDDAAL